MGNKEEAHPQREEHKSHRAGWLRAAVLGADDGIVSTASLMLGVAAGSASRSVVLTAGFAGLVAGAMSMAAGEYVSVSSQRDSEQADLAIEKRALENFTDEEIEELTDIYIDRGLTPKLARQVARQLHEHDPLAAHARDELGISHKYVAKPVQAAVSSGIAFASGSALPIASALLFRGKESWVIAATGLVALALSGAIGAYIGGGSKWRAAFRVFVGGGLAMLVTIIIGKLVGRVIA